MVVSEGNLKNFIEKIEIKKGNIDLQKFLDNLISNDQKNF